MKEMPKREDEYWARQKELKEREELLDELGLGGGEEYREGENVTETQENRHTGQSDVASAKSKAWFGSEYYDRKTRKWKKPGVKTSTKIASAIALALIVTVIVLILLYVLVWVQPAW